MYKMAPENEMDRHEEIWNRAGHVQVADSNWKETIKMDWPYTEKAKQHCHKEGSGLEYSGQEIKRNTKRQLEIGWLVGWLVGLLTSSSTTRLYRGSSWRRVREK